MREKEGYTPLQPSVQIAQNGFLHYMKYTILVLLFFTIGYTTKGIAQSPENYRIGIAANLPIINNFTDTFSAKTGWGIFGNVEYAVNKHLRFNPTLAYNNFSYNQNYFNSSNIAQRRKITEHYFDIIAELNYLPTPNANSTRLNFGMGVSFLGGRITDRPDVLGQNISSITVANKKDFTPNFIMNLGINAPLSKKIDLGIQYTISLPHKIFARDISGRLGTFQIRLSYKIAAHPVSNGKKANKRKNKKNVKAFYSLYNKDSLVIVVRLKEDMYRIKLLRSEGYHVDARKIEEKQFEKNLAIVEAFKKKFTLLPVYYFYNTDSKTILKNGFDGVLLNEQLLRDSSFRLPKKEYVIAEFAREFDEVTQTSGMYGLVIYNSTFKNIAAPFPAFTPNAYGILNTVEVIEKFQKRLYRYLNQ